MTTRIPKELVYYIKSNYHLLFLPDMYNDLECCNHYFVLSFEKYINISSPRKLLFRDMKLISYTTHCSNILWACRIIFNFLPQAWNQTVQSIVIIEIVSTVQLLAQLLSSKNPLRKGYLFPILTTKLFTTENREKTGMDWKRKRRTA